MKLWDIFLTASANMFRSKLRTILTIVAIFIGAFTLTLTNGLGVGISDYITRQVNNLGQGDLLIITAKSTDAETVGNSDTPQKYEPGRLRSSVEQGPGGSSVILTEKDITALKANKDLKDVQPSISVNPDYIQGSSEQKYRISVSQIGSSAKLDLAAGKQVDTIAADNQVVLQVNYVSALGYFNPQDAVGRTVAVGITDATGVQHTVQAKIVGIQQKGLIGSGGAVPNDTLLTHLYDLQSTGLPAASKDKYPMATAHVVGSTDDIHMNQIKDLLSDEGYSTMTIKDRLGTVQSVIGGITSVLAAFAGIALLAAGFGIVNTLLMSVQERNKEIGLMKAMGMRSSRIFLLFSTEAVLIGFWGSAIGVVAAIIAGNIGNHIMANGIFKDLPGLQLLLFSPLSIVQVMLLIMGIAFLAGTLPARRAARQNPIDALRYE